MALKLLFFSLFICSAINFSQQQVAKICLDSKTHKKEPTKETDLIGEV